MGEVIDPRLKQEINSSGFEVSDNGEGAAAVIVGKENEVEGIRRAVESEGRAVDLESYIVLNKPLARMNTSAEEVEQCLDRDGGIAIGEDARRAYLKWWKELENGSYCFVNGNVGGRLFFKDSNGSLVDMDIDATKIEDYNENLNLSYERRLGKIKGDLDKVGFIEISPGNGKGFWYIADDIQKFRDDHEKAAVKKQFNF